ncbi:hypothetical protein ACQ4PT_031358 [Festuca glaucescens]
MRIRRRPQAQALIPSPLQQQASDPSTTPQPQPPPGKEDDSEEEKRKSEELHLHRPIVDLGGEPSLPSHPQGNNVVGRSENPSGGGAQRQAGAAADGHGSLENGRREECDWPVISDAEERLLNGVIVPAKPLASTTMPVNVKEGIKSDGPKRRRGPAVLLEGSRCSRVNGRGWRCSQLALAGYSLCEHHINKGRQSRSANGNSGGGGRVAGAPKLGRTEPISKKSASRPALAMDSIEPGAAAEFS